MTEYKYFWRWRCRLPERHGKPCRILAQGGRMNSILIQFQEDGQKFCVSLNAIRKLKQ